MIYQIYLVISINYYVIIKIKIQYFHFLNQRELIYYLNVLKQIVMKY